MMTELGPETRAAFNVTRIEALALADLVEKAQALVNYHEGHYAALFDALAALFDKEGR